MTTAPDSREADSTWREIQQLLDVVVELAHTHAPAPRFYSEMLDVGVRVTAARGGILWTRAADTRFQPEHHRHADQARLADDPDAQALHSRVLESLQASSETTWVPAGAGASRAEGAFLNRGPTLSFTPLSGDREVFAVLELVHDAAEDPSLQRACDQMLRVLSDAARQWQRVGESETLRRREQFWRSCDRFAREVHAQLDLAATTGEIVNESRRLLECDRVTLVMRDGDRFEVRAISGTESIDRRSAIVRGLEVLATSVARLREPFCWDGSPSELPPEIAVPLNAYLDAAHSRWLMFWPMPQGAMEPSMGGNILGMLIVEKLTGTVADDIRSRLEMLASHAGTALNNAWEYSTLPGVSWLRGTRAALGLDRSRRHRRLVGAALVSLVVAACFLIPTDFTVEARGTLQPRVVRDVFAPWDGDVDELQVSHDQRVSEGQVLLTLHSATLDLERRRVGGELEATRERLLAVESARLSQSGSGREPTGPTSPGGSLSASEEELRRTLASLEEQLTILDQQRSSLAVRSPLSGAVLTWNLEELLAARPVQRGQALLRVGDVSGPWEARLDVSDRRIGHVLAAQRTIHQALPVRFGLTMVPGVTYSGRIDRVAGVTESDEAGRPCVRVFVALPAGEVPDPRPGATVVAHVSCGRRSVAYVWLHEVWEFVQTKILF